MNTTADISTANRLRALAKETGTDPLDLASHELQTYQAAVRELRAEREVLRRRLQHYIVGASQVPHPPRISGRVQE